MLDTTRRAVHSRSMTYSFGHTASGYRRLHSPVEIDLAVRDYSTVS